MKVRINNIFNQKKDKNKKSYEFNIKKLDYNIKVNCIDKKKHKNIDNVIRLKNNIKSGIVNNNKSINEDECNSSNNIINLNVSNYVRSGAYIKKTNNKKKKEYVDKRKNVEMIDKTPKSYYALFIFMLLLGGLSIKLVINSRRLVNEEDYAVFNSIEKNEDSNEDPKIENEQSISSNNNDTILIGKENKQSSLNSNVSTNSNNVINKVQTKVEEKVIKKEDPLVFIKPINGDILKIFSDDKVIYSKTLDMWKTHDGIDIKAEIGSKVCAIEKGKIEKIYDDAFYGKTIVINHGQGYKSSYSNLSENVSVAVGQSIKKGQEIGTIGNTSIGEFKDLPHLHLMLFKNDEIADPTSIFK